MIQTLTQDKCAKTNETSRYTRDVMCVISDVPRGWPSCEVIMVSNEEYYGGLGLGLGSVWLG